MHNKWIPVISVEAKLDLRNIPVPKKTTATLLSAPHQIVGYIESELYVHWPFNIQCVERHSAIVGAETKITKFKLQTRNIQNISVSQRVYFIRKMTKLKPEEG